MYGAIDLLTYQENQREEILTERAFILFPLACPSRACLPASRETSESHKELLGCQLKQVYLKLSKAAHESTQHEVLEKRKRLHFCLPVKRKPQTNAQSPNCKTNTAYIRTYIQPRPNNSKLKER